MHVDSRKDVDSRRWGWLRVAVVGLAVVAIPITGIGLAIASPGDGASLDAEATRIQERAFGRWWDGEVDAGGLGIADAPLGALQEAAEDAWLAGTTRSQLRAVLFSEAGRNLLAGNAAAGEGRPSPYLEYFGNRPGELAALGSYLIESPSYLGGPGGTQEELFDRFSGLRESYLASLGLVEVEGRIVDPRNPYLTPSLVSLRMGPPDPLPQPGS